jgi:hypothetical protein
MQLQKASHVDLTVFPDIQQLVGSRLAPVLIVSLECPSSHGRVLVTSADPRIQQRSSGRTVPILRTKGDFWKDCASRCK